MSGQPDYYAILGVHPTAEDEVIAAAYRALAKKYHPDAAGAALSSRFIEIQEAYEVLRDPLRRQLYDEGLARSETTDFTTNETTTDASTTTQAGTDKTKDSGATNAPPNLRESERRSPVGMALAIGALVIASTVLAVTVAKNNSNKIPELISNSQEASPLIEDYPPEKTSLDPQIDSATANTQEISIDAVQQKTSFSDPSESETTKSAKEINSRIVGEKEIEANDPPVSTSPPPDAFDINAIN